MSALKKILIVVGPLVLIVMLVLSLRGGPDLPDQRVLVDIRTGEIDRFNYGTVTTLPWKSRDDGARVMLPAHENEDGTWFVPGRYHSTIVRWYREHGDTGAVDLDRDGLIVNPTGL
jgi:hypothetical protein